MDAPRINTPTLNAALSARLRGAAVRLRACVLVEGVARVLTCVLLVAMVQFAMDYGSRGLQWSMRATVLVVALAVLFWIAWRRVCSPLGVPVGPSEIARLVERRHPELSSLLISAVRFSNPRETGLSSNSPDLMARVVQRAGETAGRLDLAEVVNARRAKWSAAIIVGVIACFTVAALGAPETTRLWFTRNVLLQELEWPKRTHLTVSTTDGEIVGAIGDDVVIEAGATGVQPREVDVYYQTVGGKRGRDVMTTIGSPGAYQYRYTVRNAREDFTFHLRGGDDRTSEYRVRLLERPRVVTTGLHVAPPAYTGLEPGILADASGAPTVLLGSAVRITAEINKPIAKATLIAGRDEVAVASPESDGSGLGARITVTIEPSETKTYHFALVDEHGLDDRRPLRFAIRVQHDEAPRVRLRVPGVGTMVTPEAILGVEMEFTDTYGLASAEMIARRGDDEDGAGVISLPAFAPRMKTYSTTLTYNISESGAEPGDRVSLLARAADYDTVSGPNSGQSPELSLRVVSPEELQAEFQRREQELRADFERLVDAQEQVRGALLSELNRPDPGSSPERSAALAALERRQRNIMSSVNGVRQQFEQILAEMRINQLASAAAEQRIGDGIVAPLSELVKRDIPAAADAVRRWSRDGDREGGSAIDPQQVALLSRMRAVLSNMLQWEGYQETVNMLRDILRLQQDLRRETRKTMERESGDIFEK